MTGFSVAACPSPRDGGISGSRTGAWKYVTVFVAGSRIGNSSVAYSGEPYSLPPALTVG